MRSLGTCERIHTLCYITSNTTHIHTLYHYSTLTTLTDALGVHDLIGALVLEHAVLVYPALVCKGVGAYDGLVGLHHHALCSSI